MIHLLKIELKKQTHYRAFWVLIILYIAVTGLTLVSGMLFLQWVKSKGGDIAGIDPLKIPLYHFPDIWHNMTYIATYFHIIPGILMIMAITNEYSYKTIRQNIIDGLSRRQFLISKFSLALLISFISTCVVSLLVVVMGWMYSPETTKHHFFQYIAFAPAFFIDLLAYMSYALFLGVFIRKAGLGIALLLFITPLEYIFSINLPDSMDVIKDYLPIHALNNLITSPFGKYIFQEIRDYVDMGALSVTLGYMAFFLGLSWWRIKKNDL
jgi:ABC-2 type transport system permease protein